MAKELEVSRESGLLKACVLLAIEEVLAHGGDSGDVDAILEVVGKSAAFCARATDDDLSDGAHLSTIWEWQMDSFEAGVRLGLALCSVPVRERELLHVVLGKEETSMEGNWCFWFSGKELDALDRLKRALSKHVAKAKMSLKRPS